MRKGNFLFRKVIMTEELKFLPIDDISPNPHQPRLHFDPEQLQELANSIEKNGLIQPIIVRPSEIFGYELIAGERRLRASKLAGLQAIPAVIKTLSKEESKLQAIVENLQRLNLNPIEEAKAYQKLHQDGLTHEEIAANMGKSRPYISNLLRLLQLPDFYQKKVEKGELSTGHARLLIGKSKDLQNLLYHKITVDGWSVRQVENSLKSSKLQNKETGDVFVGALEKEIKQALGFDVKIAYKKKGEGKITIPFNSHQEFHKIINRIKEAGEIKN